MSRPHVFVVAHVVFSLALTLGCKQPLQVHSNAEDHGFRTLIYNDEFRSRFALPTEGAYSLDPGLLAVTVRVESSPYLGSRCFMDLYLNDSVDFDYPTGSSGRHDDSSAWGLMFFTSKFSDADSEARVNRWVEERWMFRSRSYSEQTKQGIMQTGSIEAFERRLLPGLNVVTFEPICFTLDPKHGPAQVWLRRPGDTKNALNPLAPNVEQTVAFDIPLSLLLHAATATQAAAIAPSRLTRQGEFPTPKFSIPPRAK